jgi:hypothetical protein
MSFSNEIKTILKIDGKDWEKSIKSISEAEKSYFKESTENIDKLIHSKEELAKIEAEHRKKIITLNKEIKESEKQLAKDISSNNTEKIKQTKELIDSKKKDLDISIKSIDQKRAEVKNTQITIEQINRYKKLLDETKNSLQQLHGQESKRQSTQEKDIANMKEQYDNTYKLTSAQVKYNEAKKRLDGMLTSGAISQDQYNKGLATEGKLLKENKSSYETATNAVVRHLRQVETLIVSYYMLKGAWDSTIGVGINVNRTIESNTQGIAALITANTRMTTSTGQAVTNQQKFAMSQSIAAETMKKIKTAAIDTAGTFEDLIMIFQQATGQTLSMGNSMGGSIKEIIDNTIQLSKRMANIAGAIGMPLDRVREEVRSLLSGNASTDSLISTMLFGSPSQANQAMEKAKASGKDGVKKLLDEMLAPFDVLEGLMTYDIQFNRMKDAYQSLAATTTKPIFDGLTKSFASVANYLTPQKIDAIANGFEDVGNAVAAIVPPLVQVATYLALVKGGMLVWKNALPLIESATIGIVDFARGTIDAETGLNKTGTAFGRLNETFKKNAPMLAIIAAYEAYNFLIGDTLDKEKRLHDATSLKLEDIKKLSLAQAQTGLADINVGLSEMIKERDAIGKQIMSGTFGKQNAVGEWTDFGKLSKEEIFRLQSQQDTIQAQIDGMYKTKELYVAAVNVASGIQTTAKAFGELMTEGSASKTLIGLLDKYKAPLTQAQALQSQIKELQDSIKLTEKESKDKTLDTKSKNMKLQLVSEGEKRVQALQKELAEINKKESTKASSILNTEEKKEHNIELQRLDFETQQEITKNAIEAFNKIDNLDKIKFENAEIRQLERNVLVENGLKKQLESAEMITDKDEKENAIYIAKEALLKNQASYYDIILKLSEKQNDADEKSLQIEEKRKADINSLIGKYTIKKQDDELGLKERLDANKAIFEDSIANLSSITEEEKKKLDEVFEKSQERFKNENLIKQYKEDMTIDIKLNGFDEVSNSIASITNGFVDMNNSLVEYNSTMYDVSKSDKDRAKAQQKYSTDTVGAYGNMAGALGSFYKEGSTQAKNFQKVQQAMYMAQMAMQMSALMTQTATSTASLALMGAETTVAGTLAVAKQAGAGDPYTAFARVAAMTALLASFGIIVGGALGGGDKTSTSYDTLSDITANTGTGTVLGDAEQGSNSIANSLEILSELAKPEHNLLSQMNKSLISIDNKIGGVTTMLLRNAGYALGEGYTNTSTGWNNKVGIGSTAGGVGGALALGTGLELSGMSIASAGGIGTSAIAAMPWVAGALVADKLLLDGAITGAISKTVGKISGGLFGKSSTSQSLTDSGLLFGEQLITKAKEDFEGSAYQTIATTVSKKSWFKSSSSTSYATYTEGMDEEIRNQFELILNNMYDTVVSTGDMLLDSKDTIVSRLDDFVVNLGKISLKGKSGAEMQQLISDVFGKTMDEMVADAYGTTLNAFQQVGETLSQTLSRVAVGISESEYYIKRLGTAFQDVSYLDIMETQGTVGFEALRQSIEKTDESIYGMDNGLVKLIESLSGTTEELYSTYTTLNELRSQISFLGQDISGLTSSMLLGAGGLEALQDGMTSYFENFLTEQEKSIYGTNSITKEFEKLNLLLPNGKDGFVNLVNSIDITTASGQELYGRLLLLSDGFAEATKNAKEMLSTQMSVELDMAELQRKLVEEQISTLEVATDKVQKLSDAFGSMSDSIQDTISNLLGNTQEGQSQSRLIQDFWSKMEDVNKLRAKGISNLTETESTRLQGLVGDIQSLSTNIQSSQFGDNSGITKSLVSELDGLKNNLDFDNKTIKAQIVDINGNVIGVAEETGIISSLVEQLKTYNKNIESQLNIDKTLTFEDFKAGGLLGTPDEIAFRQSFQAQDFSTFNDELSDLRTNLSYLSLSTTDTAKFLDDLSRTDSVGFENIIEFFKSTGGATSDINQAYILQQQKENEISKSLFSVEQNEILKNILSGTAEDLKDFAESFNIYGDENYWQKFKDMQTVANSKFFKEALGENLINDTIQETSDVIYTIANANSMKKYGDSAFLSNLQSNEIKESEYDAFIRLFKIASGKDIPTGASWAEYNNLWFTTSGIKDTLENTQSMLLGKMINSFTGNTIEELPSFAKGTSYLPNDMVIQAHQSEMIIDPQSSDVLRKYGIKVNTQTPANNFDSKENKGIIEAINKQTEEIKNLNSRLDKIDSNTKNTYDSLESAKTSRAFKTKVA